MYRLEGRGGSKKRMSCCNDENRVQWPIWKEADLEQVLSIYIYSDQWCFSSFFSCGYLKPKYDFSSLDAAKAARSVSRYVVNQHAVITEFVDKYPMLTRKQLDYLDWKKLIELKAERAQDTPEGRLMMEKIKASMNRGR